MAKWEAIIMETWSDDYNRDGINSISSEITDQVESSEK